MKVWTQQQASRRLTLVLVGCWDRTCEYDCLVSEYEWWTLTTLLGGQDGTSGAPPGSGAGPRCHE
jgi:hypothetical protein